jgi:hypothetical protein
MGWKGAFGRTTYVSNRHGVEFQSIDSLCDLLSTIIRIEERALCPLSRVENGSICSVLERVWLESVEIKKGPHLEFIPHAQDERVRWRGGADFIYF